MRDDQLGVGENLYHLECHISGISRLTYFINVISPFKIMLSRQYFAILTYFIHSLIMSLHWYRPYMDMKKDRVVVNT